jgi:hypothetical protein
MRENWINVKEQANNNLESLYHKAYMLLIEAIFLQYEQTLKQSFFDNFHKFSKSGHILLNFFVLVHGNVLISSAYDNNKAI